MKIDPELEVKDPSAIRLAKWNAGDLPRVPPHLPFPGIERLDVTVKGVYRRVIGTSMDAYEVMVLATLARYLRPRKILEIGTYDGNTTLNLAANTDDACLLTTVDLPQEWDGTLAIDLPDGETNVHDMNGERVDVGWQFRDTRWASRIAQVFGDSASLDWAGLGGPFDLIFIDGCHHHAYVRSDTDHALAHLNAGGAIVWHDYGFIDDVSDVVDTYRDRMRLMVLQGTRLAVGFPRNLPT